MIEALLKEKLRGYIGENNPDLLLQLNKDCSLTGYLENKIAAIAPALEQWISDGKPAYILEELAMQRLTEDLLPSRYLYLKELLEEDFAASYASFRRIGVLTYELVNMVEYCRPVFDGWGFSVENEDNRQLRYAITGAMDEYLHQ
ncbi:MAG: DUF1896 family protein [Bacteroidetes bacterium]|nr:DUF1896 family protein [Bacteroidota bacterium]